MKRIFLITVVVGLGALATGAFGQPPPLPQWYLDTGLPAVDTDGDGIPDAWEIRTFGDPAVADSQLDRDGDGLTDLEEFLFGSDPRTPGTMADGWSDKEKRDAGLDSVFRVTPAVSLAQWQAWLGWDAQSWRTQTATNAEGFAVSYAGFICTTAPYSDTNLNGTVDFWLAARTDRPALLTVSDALTTNSFPVRSGNSRVRLRVAYGGPVALTLDPHPGTLAQTPGATNGPWICELSVEPASQNTVLFSDGETPPPVPGDPVSVDGLLVLAPPPAAAVQSLASPPPGVTLQPLRMTGGAILLGEGGWYCLCASLPPCDWPNYGMIGCDAVSMSMNEVAADTPLLPKEDARDIYVERFPCIECTVTQTVSNARYPFIYGSVIFSFRQCEAIGGVSGAEEHPPGHEPGYDDHSLCDGLGCSCDDGPHWVIGFGNVNTRNLNHPAEKPESDKYINHCLGVVWSTQSIDLADLSESCGLDLASLVVWEVDGKRQPSSMLALGAEPPDLEPTVFRIKMLQASNPDMVWDQFILVVNNQNTKTRFDEWYARFSVETDWMAELPAAYSTLGPNNSDPEPPSINLWAGVGSLNKHKYYHHTSVWEMRSHPTANWHGHQACYDMDGVMEILGICAGSADFGHWTNVFRNKADMWGPSRPIHELEDVDPFMRALQLDGNPCKKALNGIQTDHPATYQGSNMLKYFECRPSIPNNKTLLAPAPTP